ncbi:MAG: sulfite exporter TauE/SafE family protein [Planctomycetes bacterium]|nr:sulfite exporter TauE/SafE family protein [Planctomycetota bacterium]
MSEMVLGIGSAVWLGILTSISPCPLATNIAAISFIGRRIDNPRAAVATGLLYTLGRTVAYTALAALLVSSLLSAPLVSHVLQKYMNKILGPLLILVGMLLVGLIEFNVKGSGLAAKLGKRVETWGIWSGLALGFVFALSFCPGSAALFFGSLIPLAVKYESAFVLPTVYGAGTALPVLAFAILIVVSTNAVGRAYDRITQFEWWARRVTGVLFIGIGAYFCLAFIFRVF